MNNLMQDGKGKISSKRIAGISILANACIMAIILFGFSINKRIGDPDTAIRIINAMFVCGGGLLGIGVAEMFAKKQ